MQMVAGIVVSTLLFVAVPSAWGNGPAKCNVQLTREEAIQLLAEGSVRANDDVPLGKVPDPKAVDAAKRNVSRQLEAGSKMRFINRDDDCTVLVFFHHPDKAGSGISVRADAKKQLIDFLQHR